LLIVRNQHQNDDLAASQTHYLSAHRVYSFLMSKENGFSYYS